MKKLSLKALIRNKELAEIAEEIYTRAKEEEKAPEPDEVAGHLVVSGMNVVKDYDLRAKREDKVEESKERGGWTLFINRAGDRCHAVHPSGAMYIPPTLEHLKGVRQEEHSINWFANEAAKVLGGGGNKNEKAYREIETGEQAEGGRQEGGGGEMRQAEEGEEKSPGASSGPGPPGHLLL
jgi:hypothetical protein